MAAQPPPSRTASVGPSSAGGVNQQPPPSNGAGPTPPSQQNLNQIVLEYLNKKGYSRTEAMLRRESATIDSNGLPATPSVDEMDGRKYSRAYKLTHNWVDSVLDIYKPELKRLLWPLFVYSFVQCVSDFFSRDAQDFFNAFKEPFEGEHPDDLRILSGIYEPEHLADNSIAQIYRNNKYRLTLSNMAYQTLIGHLEAKENEGGKIILNIVQNYMDIRVVDRAAAGNDRILAKLLSQNRDGNQDVPAEDEGIPGHNPGSANLDPKAPAVLSKLSLGPMPMETDFMEDVKAELQDNDAARPPATGQNSYVDELEERIKREPLDEIPSRDNIPFPPSTARDVAMEVQKVKENRDRFRIDGRSGGVGPGVSVTMFTFHNTFDSVNCIEFSGDNTLAAVGTAESYIRVWSLDNKPLTSPLDQPSYQPSSSRRLIGHSGPVYALSFSPSIALPEDSSPTNPPNGSIPSPSQPRYLLSCSADKSIRLWSTDTWTNLVIYRSHNSPVWDVRFCPQGHYFASCGADRTARLWSTPQIAPLRIFAGHDSDVETLAWHPNNAYIFTGSGAGDRTLRMWDIQRGTPVRLFTGHTANITAIACAPTGHVVASADDRGEICLWDLASGRLVKRMRGHGRGGIWSLDWSVEASVLVSAGADASVRVWDVQPPRDSLEKAGVGADAGGPAGSGAKSDAPNGTAVASTNAGGNSAGTGASTGAAAGVNGVANSSASASSLAATPGSGKAKPKKDVVVSPDQISAFPTKKSPVYKVRFTQMNLVIAGGAYLP